MGLIFTLLISGLIGAVLLLFVAVVFLFRQSRSPERLQRVLLSRTEKPGLVGLGVFGYNVLLFGLVILLTFGGVFFAETYNIPVPMLLYAPLAVAASLIGWFLVGQAWPGSNKHRWRIAWIGSSFYWLLLVFAVVQFFTLEPSTPQEDTFMAAIGFVLLGIISGTAALSCLLLIGLPRKQKAPIH